MQIQKIQPLFFEFDSFEQDLSSMSFEQNFFSRSICIKEWSDDKIRSVDAILNFQGFIFIEIDNLQLLCLLRWILIDSA